MSPQIILILMFSLSAILIVLLLVIRKRKKKADARPAVEAASTADAKENAVPMKGSEDLDLNLQDLNLDSLFKENPSPEPPSSDLVELIRRYRFFEGKNFEIFEQLFSAKNFAGLEQLIKEKFEAQGKATPELQAKVLTKKLLESVRI